jgi:ABC-2 type transport system ATP-binding protein
MVNTKIPSFPIRPVPDSAGSRFRGGQPPAHGVLRTPGHYLQEADVYADRIVLVRHGEMVADGTASEIKAMAPGRTVRATLPGADQAALQRIPGADTVEVRGDTVSVHSNDSDAVARYLLTNTPARDLEITARGIEDAFLALTSDDNATTGTVTGSSR